MNRIDLQSFPTRRSSDLAQFSGQDEAALREQMKEDAEKRVKSNLTLEAIFNTEALEVTDEEDRKSTRLNSSHVAISYAVFCLIQKSQMMRVYHLIRHLRL